jgi:hypothetical protein
MRGEPVLINGGGTIKALSAEFLFDLQKHWRKSREQVLDDVAKKSLAQYFAGMVTLAKVIRWEVGTPGAFDRPRTPEEVMDRLEERIGPKGRELFEQFLQKVNRLEEQQLLQERQQQEQSQRKQPTVSPSGGSGGDPFERALAIAARYRRSTTAAR